jgi:hypothetical protein
MKIKDVLLCFDGKKLTFGEWDDVVVFIAEAAVAAPEAATHYVTGRVQPPALGVSPCQHRRLSPARGTSLLVKRSWPILFLRF